MSCKKMKLGFTPHRHAESSLLSICSGFKKQGVDPEQKLFRMTLCNIGGFTLIELLVVVLIIGVLAAVAVSQYKQAVLRTHFSNVWQVAQNLRKGAELYYLQNGRYKDNLLKELDIDYSKSCAGDANSLVCEGGFMIDMSSGLMNVVYSPKIKPGMTQRQALDAYNDTPLTESFALTMYFAHHATTPNQVGCWYWGNNPRYKLCRKMMQGFN